MADHLNIADGTVRIERPGKGVEPRTIFVPPAALNEAYRACGDRHLFTAPAGARLEPASRYKTWKRIRDLFDTELPPERAQELRDARRTRGAMALYELRHCAATSMRRRGATWEQIAWQLCQTDGGEQARVTYSHLTEEDHLSSLRSLYA